MYQSNVSPNDGLESQIQTYRDHLRRKFVEKDVVPSEISPSQDQEAFPGSVRAESSVSKAEEDRRFMITVGVACLVLLYVGKRTRLIGTSPIGSIGMFVSAIAVRVWVKSLLKEYSLNLTETFVKSFISNTKSKDQGEQRATSEQQASGR